MAAEPNAIERLRQEIAPCCESCVPTCVRDEAIVALAAVDALYQAAKNAEQALVDLHESLFIGSERGLSSETLGEMAKFAKAAALVLAAAVRRIDGDTKAEARAVAAEAALVTTRQALTDMTAGGDTKEPA